MAETLKYAIAVLKSGVAYPIRAADDPARNALKRLAPPPEDADAQRARQEERDAWDWYAASQRLLPEPGQHEESEGAAGDPPPLVEANAVPWYAVFEDGDGDLWVARFFGPNLPGAWPVHGVHIVTEDPGRVRPEDTSEGTRARRSKIMLSREDFGEDTSKGHDHGGGGGVIRTEW